MARKISVGIVETIRYYSEWDEDEVYSRFFDHLPREEFDRLTIEEIGDELSENGEHAEDFERHGDVDGQVWTVRYVTGDDGRLHPDDEQAEPYASDDNEEN